MSHLKLCRAICRATRANEEKKAHVIENAKALHEESDWEQAWDDAPSELLKLEPVKQGEMSISKTRETTNIG